MLHMPVSFRLGGHILRLRGLSCYDLPALQLGVRKLGQESTRVRAVRHGVFNARKEPHWLRPRDQEAEEKMADGPDDPS